MLTDEEIKEIAINVHQNQGEKPLTRFARSVIQAVLDKASEGFDEWAIENFNIAPELIEKFKYSFTCNLLQAEKAWQAARLSTEHENKKLREALRWALATCWNASILLEEDDIDGEAEDVFEKVKAYKKEFNLEEG